MENEYAKMCQDEFSSAFDMFHEAIKDRQTVFPAWLPISFANPANMAAIQKALGVGGAVKLYIFCHCCPLTSQNIAKPNENSDVCIRCKVRQ